MNEHVVNLNNAECLRSVTNLGVTHVHNVCSGKITEVPWGTMDWLALFGIGAFMAAFIFMFLVFGFGVLRD